MGDTAGPRLAGVAGASRPSVGKPPPHPEHCAPLSDRAGAALTSRERCLSISSSSALLNFDVLEELLARRRLVLLLDYDGTLTPIVSNPSKALLSEEVSCARCTHKHRTLTACCKLQLRRACGVHHLLL
jgi:hypothetical protein